jgi:hypothetical protein
MNAERCSFFQRTAQKPGAGQSRENRGIFESFHSMSEFRGLEGDCPTSDQTADRCFFYPNVAKVATFARSVKGLKP